MANTSEEVRSPTGAVKPLIIMTS